MRNPDGLPHLKNYHATQWSWTGGKHKILLCGPRFRKHCGVDINPLGLIPLVKIFCFNIVSDAFLERVPRDPHTITMEVLPLNKF